MSIDNNIIVNIGLDATPVTRVGFGTVLCAGASTFSPELTRTYNSYAEAAADSASLTSAQLAAVAAIFGGTLKPSQVKVGTISVAFTAQVVTYVIGSTTDGTWTITINGEGFGFAASSNTIEEIRDGLISAINGGSEPVTAAPVSTDTITLTADVAGTSYTYANTVPSGATITETLTTANANPGTSLDTLLAEDSDWYGLVLDSRAEDVINNVAAWTESNERLYMPQSSDAGVRVAATTTDVASDLSGNSYERTALISYLTDATRADASWLGGKLSIDPDTQSTVWANYTLVGVPPEKIDATARAAMDGKDCNYYTTFYGVGSTWPGIAASGRKLDIRITADWIKARLEEDFAQILLNASNSGSKVPYTNAGIQVFANAMRARIQQGIDVGHFVAGTETFDIPDRSEVSSADLAARTLRMGFTVEPAGAIEKVVITGVVALPI